jgi:hypothetical protein
MNRSVFIIGIALALIAAGCGSDNPQPAKASVTRPPVTPLPAVEQPKPSPMAPVEPPPASAVPASSKPKSARVHRVRPIAPVAVRPAPVAAADSRSAILANGILNLPLQERLEWGKQEFAKRGIDVHDNK